MASSPDVVPADEVSWLDNQLLQASLEDKAEIINIDVKRATTKGDNYQSSLYRTRVEYRLPDSENAHSKELIVKVLPPGEFAQIMIAHTGIFKREMGVYSEGLPKLYAFANSRLGGSFKKFTPLFYKTARPDTLILDDLKAQGFVMVPRKDRLDYAHTKLAILYLARLHALSLAYNDSNPEFLSEYEETMFSEKSRDFFVQFMSPIVQNIIDAIKTWEGFDDVINKLERNKGKFVDKFLELCKPAENFTNVLIHGDFWMNNILYKYSETGEPVDLCMVDFQVTRKSSPALDLQYYLFTSLQTQVRVNHVDDLLNEYCNEVANFLKQLGYNKPIFNIDDLRSEMERTVFFGFYSAITTMAGLLANPEDTPDMKNFTEEQMRKGGLQIFNKIYENPAFREILQDLLPYFDKHGVFD